LQYHDFPVQHSPARQGPQEPQFGIAIRHVDPMAVDQAIAALLDKGQDAGAVPLYFKEVLVGIKRNPCGGPATLQWTLDYWLLLC